MLSSLMTKTYTLSSGEIVLEKRTKTPLIIIILGLLVIYSARITGVDINQFIRRIHEFFTIIESLLNPNWGYAIRILPELFQTIKMSLFGSVVGATLALPLAVVASANIISHRLINGLVKSGLSLIRTVPTLVMALIATYVFDLPMMAGTIAIILFTTSYIGKLMYEAIENVDMGAFQAMEAMGSGKLTAFRLAIFPHVLPTYLSISLYSFEGNVRYAAILGYVGAGGIGRLINETIGWRDYESLGMIILLLVVTVFLIESLSGYFRKKLI